MLCVPQVNKYTMWVKTVEGVTVPVHYEMRGYNNLLGSHYDHYYVDYENFAAEVRMFTLIKKNPRKLAAVWIRIHTVRHFGKPGSGARR